MSAAGDFDVSIVMATYNGERFLRAQLGSLAAQTLRPRELVVGDDGSVDRTLEIVRDFAEQAPFAVRVHRQATRLGCPDNFLSTARMAAGEWIAFCDQDDVWLPDKLERVAEVVRHRPDVVLAAHRASLIDEHGNPAGELNEPPVGRLSFYGPLDHRLWRTPFGFTEVFRRFLVADFPFSDRPPSTTHDCWVFWLANVCGSTAFLPDRLAAYRRHSTNASQFTQHPGLGDQLADEGGHAAYERAAERAEEFAGYLRRHQDELCAAEKDRAAAAETIYRRLAARLRRRGDLWNRGGRWAARFGLWSQLVAGGGYGANRDGGMGWQSGLKDFARLFASRSSAAASPSPKPSS